MILEIGGSERMQTRNLTIVFTDIKGFTPRTSAQSRSATIDLIREHKALLAPVIEERGGRLIKTIGDAFLVTFESPTDAVLTGIELQRKLRERNANVAEADRIEIRVAINTGEVSIEEGDVYGEAVNIAARIEGIADANEIYFTEATYLAMNKAEVPSAEIGYRVLKGIPQKIKVYRVLHEGETPPPHPMEIRFEQAGTESVRVASLVRRAAAFAVDVLLVILAVFLLTAGVRSKADKKLTEIRKQAESEGFQNLQDVPEGHALQSALQGVKARRDKLKKGAQGIGNLLFVLYVTLSLGLKGQTMGKRLLNLRVLRVDGSPLKIKHAFLRAILYYLSAFPFFLGFAWALWDPRRMAWHDKISDTAVFPARA